MDFFMFLLLFVVVSMLHALPALIGFIWFMGVLNRCGERK